MLSLYTVNYRSLAAAKIGAEDVSADAEVFNAGKGKSASNFPGGTKCGGDGAEQDSVRHKGLGGGEID